MIAKLDTSTPFQSTEKKLHSPKVWIFLGLTLIFYGLIFYKLFGQFFVFSSMIYVMAFFIAFHFLYLEIRKLPIKYLLIVMLAISAIEGFFIGYSHLLLVLSMLAINAGVVMLANNLQGESHDKVKFSSRGYFNVGGYMFTVFITIGYCLFVLGYYEKFPFTCEGLSNASNSVVDFVSKPFKIGIDEAKDIKSNIELLFTSQVKELSSISVKNDKKSVLMSKIDDYKKSLIDQAVTDNSNINMGICDYVLGELNKIYGTSGFQTSVILLMYLLLYGFVRIIFRVMAGIAFLIFKILFRLKVYHIKTVLKEVEDLE